MPVEWDDLREQLQRVTELLQPTQPGGVSTLGALINTAADNLRGQGATIRDTIIKLSQTVSALGDHSKDIFATFRNLSTLVSALHDSADLLEQLNHNLAAVSSLLADDPNKVGQAAQDLNAVVGDVRSFAADNREALGTTSDKLASITTALVDSLDDIKQTLHIAPTAFMNFNNIYEPANGALTGALAVNNFANPIGFLCGAVQAASRLGGRAGGETLRAVPGADFQEPPVQLPAVRGGPLRRPTGQAQRGHLQRGLDAARLRPAGREYARRRPNRLRPGPLPPAVPAPGPATTATVATDPAAGLSGMMVPPGGGS